MIRLTYELIRDEKDEIRTYVPSAYPTEFNNLVYIKGPNGSGKSFILHIISLALYGNHLKKEQLDPGLKSKIENLLDLKKNKLKFSLEIDSPTNDLTIISRKPDFNSNDIFVYIKRDGIEQLYPKEKFLREFRLLYTIPNNPTTQLPQLLSEIKVSQGDVSNRIIDFRHFLEERVRNLEKSRDESQLERKRIELSETRAIKSEVEDRLFKFSDEHNRFITYFTLQTFLDAGSRIVSLSQNKNLLDAEIKDLEKKVVRKSRAEKESEKKYTEIMSTIGPKKMNLMPLLAKYTFSDLRQRYSFINDSSVQVEIRKPTIQRTIRDNLNVFLEKIELYAKSEETANAKHLDSLELYKSLKQVLNNPRYYGLKIPGLEGDTGSFIGIIESEIEKILVIQQRIDSLYSDVKKIRTFLGELETAIAYNSQIDKDYGEREDSIEELKLEDLNRQKDQIDQALKRASDKRIATKQKLMSLHEDPDMATPRLTMLKGDPLIKQFSQLSEAEQEKKINELAQSISSLQFKSKQQKSLYESQNKAIYDLERQQADPNREYLPELKEISRKLVSLESLFRSELPASLTKIDGKNAASFNDFDKKYSDRIGRYYAQKMGTVFHADGTYKVQSVDIVNEVIKTTAGKEINFDYLSTGHSQSSYLTTRLGMADSKKVIALFDEVAMMDENSLSPVIKLLKSKFQDGSLLGSIIVQRAETPSVEEL